MTAMWRAGTASIAALLLALPAPAAPASEASVQAPALASLWPDSVASGALAPPVRSLPTSRLPGGSTGAGLGTLAARGEAAGAAAGRPGASWIGGRAAGTLSFWPAGGPTFALLTQALVTRRPAPPGGGALRTEALARFGEGASRFSIGAGMERDLATEDPPTRGVFSAGIARQVRDVAIDLRLERSRRSVRVTRLVTPEPIPGDTLAPVSFPVERAQDVAAVSARLGTRWQRGHWMLESAAGVMLHRFAAPQRWVQSSLSLALGRDLAVWASLGSAPRWLALEPAAERRASMGLRLVPGIFPAMSAPQPGPPAGPTWRLIRARHGWTLIQVRAPGAERVELTGDFTGWQPMSLRRMAGSRWELGLTLAPGVHLVNLRVDGGPWTPPAGLPTAADGFDGVAGVVVIE